MGVEVCKLVPDDIPVRERKRAGGRDKMPLFNEPLLMTSKWGHTARESISWCRPSCWMHLLKTQSTTHNTGINTQTHTHTRSLCDNHPALMRAQRWNYTVAEIRRAFPRWPGPSSPLITHQNKMSCVWIALWFDCHHPRTLIHYCFLIQNVPEFKKLIMIFSLFFFCLPQSLLADKITAVIQNKWYRWNVETIWDNSTRHPPITPTKFFGLI